jgi:hypothetical protein
MFFVSSKSVRRVAGFAVLTALSTVACSSSSSSGSTPAGGGDDGGAGEAAAQAYSVTFDLALAKDASGRIPLSNVQGAQSVSPSDVTGKMVYAVLYAEGNSPPNDAPIDNGAALVESNLQATIHLSNKHPDGTYEVAMVVSISGWVPGPGATQPGAQDLVAFTNPITAPKPADGVPYTGKTIRFVVNGDTMVPVDNTEFIEYGSASGGGPADAGAE